MPVPWPVLLSGANLIVTTALKVFDRVSTQRRARPTSNTDTDRLEALRADISGVQQRLDMLEDNEVEQAELISRMAKQEEALLRGMQAMSSRLVLLQWALVASAAIAITALALALLKQ